MPLTKNHSDLLAIYLDDHRAGAAAGLQLARRLSANNRRTEWSQELVWLADQISDDVRVLDDLRQKLDIEGGRVKRALAFVGERVARIKLNGRLLSYSPLSRVLEAEAMISGVAGKRSLWRTLQRQPLARHELDLDRLVGRADEQLELLERFHHYAAQILTGQEESADLDI